MVFTIWLLAFILLYLFNNNCMNWHILRRHRWSYVKVLWLAFTDFPIEHCWSSSSKQMSRFSVEKEFCILYKKGCGNEEKDCSNEKRDCNNEKRGCDNKKEDCGNEKEG